MTDRVVRVLGGEDLAVVDVGVEDAFLVGVQRGCQRTTVGPVDAGMPSAESEEFALEVGVDERVVRGLPDEAGRRETNV